MIPQRYNRTNFVTSAVAVKILKAMQGALKDGLQHYIENKRGQRWLRVCIQSVDGSDNRFTFKFHAGNGQDVGHLILQALFVWSDDLEREFSVLMGELYRLTNHPYTLAGRKVAQDRVDAADKAAREHLESIGVTHVFKAPNGFTVLGRYARNWLGRKGFLVVADEFGRAVSKQYRLTAEAYLYGSSKGIAA
jgi:hypothetical protein